MRARATGRARAAVGHGADTDGEPNDAPASGDAATQATGALCGADPAAAAELGAVANSAALVALGGGAAAGLPLQS